MILKFWFLACVFALDVGAAPILGLTPIAAINHNGFELHAPGLIPNLPGLWTYRPIGTPAPDFNTCGQVGFIPTLENGSPDPAANPAFLQINSGCSPPTGTAIMILERVPEGDYNPPDRPADVPEPGTGAMIGIAWLACMGLWFVRRSK